MVICKTINTESSINLLWEGQHVCKEQNWTGTGPLGDTEGQVLSLDLAFCTVATHERGLR